MAPYHIQGLYCIFPRPDLNLKKGSRFGTILSALKGDSRGALSDHRKCRKPRQPVAADLTKKQQLAPIHKMARLSTLVKEHIEVWVWESLCLKRILFENESPRRMAISIGSQKRGKLVAWLHGLTRTRPHCAVSSTLSMPLIGQVLYG